MQEEILALQSVLVYWLIRWDSGIQGREKNMRKDTSKRVWDWAEYEGG